MRNPKHYTKLSIFKADCGYVCPLYFDNISIYQQLPNDMKVKFINNVSKEWPHLTHEMIQKTWSGGSDIMYVYHIDNDIIGCVAIDRLAFNPYISHLYVVDEFRKKGYGSILLQTAEFCIKEMGFSESRLSCHVDLLPYYETKNYKIEKHEDGMYFLIK